MKRYEKTNCKNPNPQDEIRLSRIKSICTTVICFNLPLLQRVFGGMGGGGYSELSGGGWMGRGSEL